MGKLQTGIERSARKEFKRLLIILQKATSYLLRSPGFTEEEFWEELIRIKEVKSTPDFC